MHRKWHQPVVLSIPDVSFPAHPEDAMFPAVLEAYEEMERFFSEKGEKDLLQMMMYRYLSMVRRYASDAVKSGDEEEIRLGRYYDKKFRKDYRKYIWKIKKPKRKFRLWMYYHFKICV